MNQYRSRWRKRGLSADSTCGKGLDDQRDLDDVVVSDVSGAEVDN